MSGPQSTTPQAPLRRRLGRRLGVGCLVLVVLFVVVVVVVIAASGGDDTADTVPGAVASPTVEAEGDGDPLTSPEPEPSPSSTLGGAADDITVTSCAESGAGFWAAGLTILASADKTSTYIITIGVLAADGSRVGSLLATAEAISPGQTATVEALGTVTAGAVGATCEVVDVERFSS